MKKHLLSALGYLACVLALAAAAVLPYRAMLAQDAARLSSPHPIPGGASAGGLCEAAAQSAAAQALYGRMRVLGEANAGSAAAQPAEFDESLLAGAADALFGAGALPQVYAPFGHGTALSRRWRMPAPRRAMPLWMNSAFSAFPTGR